MLRLFLSGKCLIIGNAVRALKAVNPKSEESKAAIAKLLDLKQMYREVAGREYKPESASVVPPDKNDSTKHREAFMTRVSQQGDLVRSLKAKDAKSVRFIRLFFPNQIFM